MDGNAGRYSYDDGTRHGQRSTWEFVTNSEAYAAVTLVFGVDVPTFPKPLREHSAAVGWQQRTTTTPTGTSL